MVPTLSLYSSTSSSEFDAYPPGVATSDLNIFYGSNWMSSGLTAAPADFWSLFYFELRLQRVGNPGPVELRLYEASSYLPPNSATLLAQQRALRGYGVFDGDRISLGVPSTRIFYLDSAPTLAAGANNYVLVLSAPEGSCSGPCDGGAGDHYVIWRVETGTAAIGGSSADSGLTWAAIAGGVHPHTRWMGRTLLPTFTSSSVLIEYVPDSFLSGQRRGSLYWPTDITPTSDHDAVIPDYVLAIVNKTASPTQPDAVYELTQACQIVRTAPVSGGFNLLPISAVTSSLADDIPFLSLLGDLAPNLGMDYTSGFFLLTIIMVIIALVLVTRFTTNFFLVLFTGLLPVVFMAMQGLLPGGALMIVGLYAAGLIGWKVMVKQDV